MREGQFLARGWPEAQIEKMLQAEYFLKNGGQKGPQLTVLKPGKYRLNQYLFSVTMQPSLEVKAGEVAVVKSNVEESDKCPSPSFGGESVDTGGLAVPLVPHGCIGVWDTPLLPSRYYLNSIAYNPTILSTRVQT